jgi:SsrA-binding protein
MRRQGADGTLQEDPTFRKRTVSFCEVPVAVEALRAAVSRACGRPLRSASVPATGICANCPDSSQIRPRVRGREKAARALGKTAEKTQDAGDIKVVTTNRKARHDFQILDTLEAGISLQGTEVKSLRAGRVNLKDSHAEIRAGEVFLIGAHISPYTQGNRFNHDPERDRRLLLHKREIVRLGVKVREKGLTIVPLRIYFKSNRAKVELALARGKRMYDKREAIAKRDVKRELDRAMKEAKRG